MISVSHLSKTYPGPQPRRVLNDVSFDVARGEFVAIIGESGIGKSTLLNLIAGLEQPGRGPRRASTASTSRTLDDDALTRCGASDMGFVFQAFHILPYLTVAQNVALAAGAARPARRDGADARTREMLAAVGLADRAASLPRELSGGELQRVAIARALVHAPRARAGRRADRQPRSGKRRARDRAAARMREGERRDVRCS